MVIELLRLVVVLLPVCFPTIINAEKLWTRRDKYLEKIFIKQKL